MKTQLILISILAANTALAQTAKDPKAKPGTKTEEAKPADTKPADTKPADAKAAETTETTGQPKADAVTTPPPPTSDRASADPYEAPNKTYQFIGARYRGTIIPKFLLNTFINEGATAYSNSIGIEYERRTDGFSIIPSLSYTEFGTNDTLVLEKGKPENVIGNWVAINSSMKGLYAAVDLLWSTKINKQFAFEFGFGVGLGVIFDSLMINWVKDDPNGNLTADNGRRFSLCTFAESGELGTGPNAYRPGCGRREHSNSTELKVDRYQEKSWLNGGSKPVIFPTITIPNLGLRYKPHAAFAARLQFGFSITGFWFGLSGSYGFPGKAVTRSPKPTDNVEVEETVE
jgi:hypothetical protein